MSSFPSVGKRPTPTPSPLVRVRAYTRPGRAPGGSSLARTSAGVARQGQRTRRHRRPPTACRVGAGSPCSGLCSGADAEPCVARPPESRSLARSCGRRCRPRRTRASRTTDRTPRAMIEVNVSGAVWMVSTAKIASTLMVTARARPGNTQVPGESTGAAEGPGEVLDASSASTASPSSPSSPPGCIWTHWTQESVPRWYHDGRGSDRAGSKPPTSGFGPTASQLSVKAQN
jgi:hypothetical protein